MSKEKIQALHYRERAFLSEQAEDDPMACCAYAVYATGTAEYGYQVSGTFELQAERQLVIVEMHDHREGSNGTAALGIERLDSIIAMAQKAKAALVAAEQHALRELDRLRKAKGGKD